MCRNRFIVVAVSMIAFVFTGCAGEEAGLTKKTPAPTMPSMPSAGSPTDASCSQSGFAAGTESGAIGSSEQWAFQAYKPDGTAFVSVSSLADWNGPMTTGSYSLDGINYKDCGLCLLAGTGCDGGQNCSKVFYASEGTVNVTSLGAAEGETLAGLLEGVVFEEVTIAEDYTSTPVSGGDTWCFNEYAFNETIAADPNAPMEVVPYEDTSDTCVVDGNGTNLGHNIAGFELQNCAGETVNLQEQYCGQGRKALWLATSAEWCGPCLAYDPIYYDLASKNDDIDFYVILGQDAGATTNISCPNGFGQEYIPGIGPVPPSNVLIDPNWTTTDRLMNDYQAPGIPYSRVLNGDNMEYVWTEQASTDTISDLPQALQEGSGQNTLNGWNEFVQNMNSLQ